MNVQNKIRLFAVAGLAAMLGLLGGCLLGGLCDAASIIEVQGTIVDAGTGMGVPSAAIGVKLITDGEITEENRPMFNDGTPRSALTNESGEFRIDFQRFVSTCPFESHVGEGIPYPDRIELAVVVNGCRRDFAFDINEETVVDLRDPMRVIELKEVILFSSCEVP